MPGAVLPFPDFNIRELSDLAPEIFTVALEPGNKIILPDAVRQRLGVPEKGKLALTIQRDGTVVMASLRRVVDEAQHELVRERQARASRESKE